MNTSGCPGGSAQDQLFLYGAAGDCSATIATFNAVFGAMVALRVVVTLMQWAVWTMRYCRPATAASKAVRNRVPFVPILSSFALVAFVLLYALSLVDVVNDANGGAPFLVGVFYFPLVLCSVMYQHRIIKLGAKIFPWAAKTKILQDGSIATQNLVKYDGVLKVNVVITGLSIAQFVVALMLLPLALDGKRMLSRVGFAALGQMFVMAGLSIGWQLQRVLDVFVEHVRTSELKHRSHSRNDGLRTAVRIFRAQVCVVLYVRGHFADLSKIKYKAMGAVHCRLLGRFAVDPQRNRRAAAVLVVGAHAQCLRELYHSAHCRAGLGRAAQKEAFVGPGQGVRGCGARGPGFGRTRIALRHNAGDVCRRQYFGGGTFALNCARGRRRPPARKDNLEHITQGRALCTARGEDGGICCRRGDWWITRASLFYAAPPPLRPPARTHGAVTRTAATPPRDT